MGTFNGDDKNANPVSPLLDGLGNSLFDALSPHIAILDEQGKVLAVNKSWRSFSKLHPPPPHSLDVGDNYLETCRKIVPEYRNEGEAFQKGFFAVEKGLHLEFSYEFSADLAGGCRWFQCKMTPLELAGSRNILLSHEDITELKQAQNQIRQLAYFDNLTGLPNRILFCDRLNQALSKAERNRKMVAVLFLDLDRFKVINDTLGHAAGDQLLQIIAQRIKNSLRAMDTVARFAGDEFVIILPDLENPDDASLIAKKLLKLLPVKVRVGDHDIFPSCSIGIALYPDDAQNSETLIGYADLAMYHAKESGRHNFQFFSQELNMRVKARMRLETDLRRALQQQEFNLFYQPVFNLLNGRWVAVKTLLRWNHPQRGLLSAQNFIALCEETGLILSLGEWALRKGCRQVKEWQEAGFPDLQLSVNLSPRQIQAPGTIEKVSRVLQETGLDPAQLVLEIDETVFLKSLEENIPILMAFRNLGIQIAVNDFGYSFSSLRYIKRLGINRLQIDRSFIKNTPGNPEDEAITEAIIKMGKSLQVKVLGKGVEKSEQMKFLLQHQCDEIVGFYFDAPAAPEDLLARVRSRATTGSMLPSSEDGLS